MTHASATATATGMAPSDRAQAGLDSGDVAAIAARIPDAPPEVRGSRVEIAAAIGVIVARVQPVRVVLFGSRAYGTPTWDSDIDLMVILASPRERQAVPEDVRALVRCASPGASIHVHTRTSDQIALGLAEGDFFIQDVMLKGISLYDDGRLRVIPEKNGGAGRDSSRPKQATMGWIQKAESDVRVARLIQAGSGADDHTVCIHAQQATEKYRKALLQERDVRHAPTLDLAELADGAVALLPDLGRFRADFTWLSGFAVDSRYPDTMEGPIPKADRAIGIATDVRRPIRDALGLTG